MGEHSSNKDKNVVDEKECSCRSGQIGDYYARKGLDIKTRELLTFSKIFSLCG
jgi:alkylhydroperoxidase/carboxymuconolactone decarboxylase family protein YurZ